jgi:signal peptidase I
MSIAVLDASVAKPTSAFGPASAVARLIVKAVFGVVVLGLLTVVAGPKLLPFQAFYVRTGSMTPGIPIGALVVATRTPAEDLEPGEVIVFQRPDQPGIMVVHRIESVRQTSADRVFTTKGDANSGPDGWQVPASGNGWRATYSIDRLGFIVGWLHVAMSGSGWVGTLAVLAAIYALILIWRCEEP